MSRPRRLTWWFSTTSSPPPSSGCSRRRWGSRSSTGQGLILDIFAQRARTKRGPPPGGTGPVSNTCCPASPACGGTLSRQTASGGKSPIGTRGPGETQIGDRPPPHPHPKNRQAHRGTARRCGGCAGSPAAAAGEERGACGGHLMGYTNAGKSTLLNALTGAGIPARNRLFDTLDTTTRTLEISDTCTVLISDTVGFIRKLPHHLVEAFKATLEELSYAAPDPPRHRRLQPRVAGAGGGGGGPHHPTGSPDHPADRGVQQVRHLRGGDPPPRRGYTSPSPPKPGRGWTSCWKRSASGWTPGSTGSPWPCPMTRAAFWTPFTGRPRWSPWSTGETIQVVAVCAEKTIGQIRAYVVDGWQPPKAFWED